MANLNRVFLMGNLTRDPELRYTPNGTAVADFGLAVNRFWKGQDGNRQEETTFVDITTWTKTAELAQQYLRKGSRVFIEGRLKFESWTTAEGQKRSKLSVVCENFQFLDRAGQGPGGPPQGQAQGGYQGADRAARPPADDPGGYGGGYAGGFSQGPGRSPNEGFGGNLDQSGGDDDMPF